MRYDFWKDLLKIYHLYYLNFDVFCLDYVCSLSKVLFWTLYFICATAITLILFWERFRGNFKSCVCKTEKYRQQRAPHNWRIPILKLPVCNLVSQRRCLRELNPGPLQYKSDVLPLSQGLRRCPGKETRYVIQISIY